MSKYDDVIVQSSQDVATLVAQLMSATTVLHVLQADINYTIRSVEPWEPLPNLLFIRQMHAADYTYSLEELMLRMWYVSGQNDPSIELITPQWSPYM